MSLIKSKKYPSWLIEDLNITLDNNLRYVVRDDKGKVLIKGQRSENSWGFYWPYPNKEMGMAVLDRLDNLLKEKIERK